MHIKPLMYSGTADFAACQTGCEGLYSKCNRAIFKVGRNVKVKFELLCDDDLVHSLSGDPH